jgi:nucleoside-diphosphate kinase
MKMIHMDESLARHHYAVHEDKPFFSSLIEFITSGPIIAAVIEGNNAVDAVRQLMGSTDPLKATAGSIRGDLGLDLTQNLVHGSDSDENAQKEISNFFNDDEIITMNYRHS